MTEKKPKIQENEMDKLEQQFNKFDASVKELTKDRMDMTPKSETEPQTKLSSSEIEKSKDIYLKPSRAIGSREKFNESYRDAYNFDKEYVHFIAENNEIKGETLEMWTKPYAGMPAEYWQVPTNKPVWGPRYLAEQIKRKSYHRLMMQDTVTGGDGMGKYYGQMAVDTSIQRLDARPISTKKSVFMGALNF